MQRYDAQNSYITLGNQLLLANQMLQQLMVSENTYDRVAAIEDHMGLLEGMLASYTPFMDLHYFDMDKKKMVKIEGYEASMRHITTKLEENKGATEDKQTRSRYIYWLNRKYQLLSSCYGKLKLVPELSSGEDDSLMSTVGVDKEVVNREFDEEDEIIQKKTGKKKEPSELQKIEKEYEEKIRKAREEMGEKPGVDKFEIEDEDSDYELESEED